MDTGLDMRATRSCTTKRACPRGGRPILVYKFRSMVVDAETRLQDLLVADPSLRDEYKATYKLRDDPRVTPLGRWLRRTSLDELPPAVQRPPRRTLAGGTPAHRRG